ncbi:lipoprotein B [Nitratiruptor sp. YY08-26]|uniref:DedA family protein n=1 Tax=unclassified Nitratiruptor TaxID=2624044 RepID=UPI001914EBF4|nr:MULTISPECIES: DedA family protein [unclassified Nitratiruptor]BCD61970.1 lipoprotein B [Nitratiruptor sp. YY08-13]BCD65906.1 lipoprotein B [Nitratiruptor sp. YY08-26]
MILKFFSYPISLLLAHGYIALFIWSILEGEIGLMLAGWLAHQGKVFTFEKIIIIASIGALIGDTFTFSVGRFFRKRALAWLNTHPQKKDIAQKLIKNYGSFVIIFERFIYGTHIPVMLTLGMSGYSYVKFYIYEIIGVFLWAVTFTSIGFYLGDTAIQIVVLLQKKLLALLVFILFVLWIFKLQKE